MSNSIWPALIACLVLAVAVLYMLVGLIGAKKVVAGLWAETDFQLKRRYELIPKIVEAGRSVVAHERAILESVTRARNLALSAASTPNDRASGEQELQYALAQLFDVAQQNPSLGASARFQRLWSQLAGIEESIEAHRARYNAGAVEYNNKARVFPFNLIAVVFRFGHWDAFEFTTDRA